MAIKTMTLQASRSQYNLDMAKGQLKEAEKELAYELSSKNPDQTYIRNLRRDIPKFKKELELVQKEVARG